MASCTKRKENATDIAKHICEYPNIKNFLKILVRNCDVTDEQVGQRFKYPHSIVKNRLQPTYGVFMDYFIRKVLSNQHKFDLTDDNTELVLGDRVTYFRRGRLQNADLSKDIEKNYVFFKDSKCKAMENLKSIKTVSLSTLLFFHDELPRVEVESENANLLEIIKYFKKLCYCKVQVKFKVDCEYFDGNADIIFDERVMYEIKTSQYSNLKRSDPKFNVANFYKLLLYGFGYYKATGVIIKKFIIYNPLLGNEHEIQLNDIDMVHFEEVLKKDLCVHL